MSEIFAAVVEANIATALAILIVVLIRDAVRKLAGAHAAYLLWSIVPIAAAATFMPARTASTIAGNDVGEILATGVSAPAAPHSIAATQADWTGPFVLAAPYIWLAGMLAGFVWLAFRHWQFTGDARRGLAGPAVMGVLRQRIVTPSDFGARFDEGERNLIIAHETAHMRRGDARVNTAVALAQCVCWFNPLIHIGARLFRIDQELSCDALVIERRPDTRRAYAETLLKTQLAGRPLPFGCYWPARSQHPLTQRVAMIARPPVTRTRRLLASAAVMVLAASSGYAAWAVQPEQPPQSSTNNATSVADTSAKRAYETYQRVLELIGGRFPRASDTPERYRELLGDRWVDADRARNILEGLDPDVRVFLASRADSQLLPGGQPLHPGETSALDQMTARYDAYFELLKVTPLTNT